MSSFVEEFARPDAATLGSGWAESTAGFHIVSGAAVPDTTATNVAQRNLSLATGNHRARMELGDTYGGSFVGPAARMPTLGTDGTATGGYYTLILSGSTGTAFSIRRKEPNSTTLTTLPGATGNTAGDSRFDGSACWLDVYDDPANATRVLLRGYVNGALIVSAVDTSGLVPSTQRRIGMYAAGATAPDLRIARITGEDIAPQAADTIPPTVPGSVVASAVSASSVAVSWAASTDANGVASYRVRRDGADVATEVIGRTYTDTGLTAGTHTYTVSAVDAAGNRSAESLVATVTIVPVDTTPPAVPSGVTATAGANRVNLSWAGVVASDLVGYRVYRWTTAAPTHVLIASPAGTSFTDTGIAAGTAYSYAVRSVDQAGNASAESATATATPTTPTGVTGPSLGIWDGTAVVPVNLLGIWNGGSVTAISSVSIVGSGGSTGGGIVPTLATGFEVSPAGTAIPTTGAGNGGDAFSAGANGTGTAMVSDNSIAASIAVGSFAAKITVPATPAVVWRGWNISPSGSGVHFRLYLYTAARVAGNWDFVQAAHTTGGTTTVARARMTSTGQFQHVLGATAGTATTGVMPLNALVRVEGSWNVANGTFTMDAYLGHSTTPIANTSISLTGITFADTIEQFRIGFPTAGIANAVVYTDAWGVSDVGRMGPV